MVAWESRISVVQIQQPYMLIQQGNFSKGQNRKGSHTQNRQYLVAAVVQTRGQLEQYYMYTIDPWNIGERR